MTNDKVRQDFEAWYYAEYGIKAGVFSLGTYHNRTTQRSFEAYQAGRAAERAEIREKLESEGFTADAATAARAEHYNRTTKSLMCFENLDTGKKRDMADIMAGAAITKILEVI